jgi:hypothetical protein
MPLTFASFASTLGTLSVAGVTANTTPPQRIPSGILPIGYPRLPNGENRRSVLTSLPDLDQVTCDYVVLVEAAGQNTLPNNYAGTVAIMDLVHAALKAAMAANHEIDSWTIRMDIELIGETPYWAIIATVRGSA